MATSLIIVWLVFIIIISLLFFAAFGNSKYNESSIEEYMQNLIDEEQQNGPA